MQHGVKRVEHNALTRKTKHEKDAPKIQRYRDLSEKVLKKRDKEIYTQVTFDLTTQLLNLNPEFYTIWNYRRDILTNGLIPSHNTPEETTLLFKKELQFTMFHLQKLPKCYWIWLHRMWCLETNPAKDFTSELEIVSYLLSKDARNFHGWHYRRYVVGMLEKEKSKRLDLSEFKYTTKLIGKNFSNYSAMHNRTKLTEKMFNNPLNDNITDEEEKKILLEKFNSKLGFIESELAFMKNAIYTDPDDQSVWLYLNWLTTSPFFIEDQKIDKKALATVLWNFVADIDELNEIEKEDNGHDNNWCLKIKSAVLQTMLLNFTDVEKSDVKCQNQELKNEIKTALEILQKNDSKRFNRYKFLMTQIQ